MRHIVGTFKHHERVDVDAVDHIYSGLCYGRDCDGETFCDIVEIVYQSDTSLQWIEAGECSMCDVAVSPPADLVGVA